MTKLANPVPLFLDGRGALLDGGYIYVGKPGTDPRIAANRINLFWDKARTIPAAQPLRTLGGVIVNGANHAFVYFAEEDFSVTVLDADQITVQQIGSANDTSGVQYQPLDADLTAIAEQGTSSFGRSLLGLADAAALKTVADIKDALPNTGGTISGNITRSGAGAHFYSANAAFTGCRVFGPNPEGTADATSQPGDIQLFHAP